MPHILHIDASPRGDASVSRELSREAVDALKRARVGTTVDRLDLALDAPPAIGAAAAEGTALPPEARTPAQAMALAEAEALVARLKRADTVVIGTPMHNFGMPARLKSWFDAVVRAGETFAMTDAGPKGLMTRTRVLAIVASGGDYRAGAMFEGLDHLGPHLQTLFSWMGFAEARIIHAQPTQFAGQPGRKAALAGARAEIADYVRKAGL